jgi:hypothetical protein
LFLTTSETAEQCQHALRVGFDALTALKVDLLLDPEVGRERGKREAREREERGKREGREREERGREEKRSE